MKHIILAITLITLSVNVLAHIGGHGTSLREWKIEAEVVKADFIKYEQGKVWLSAESHQIVEYTISDFSPEDQAYILDRHQQILAINHQQTNAMSFGSFSKLKLSGILLGGMLLLFSAVQVLRRKKGGSLAYGVLGSLLILLISCGEKALPTIGANIPANDVSFMKSVFESFAEVSTDSDTTYFYVASQGLPTHEMMVGITNWQQQVPINQHYTDDNSWAIPIQPALAANPLSTQTNLLKGAIAIAANGIPIFNPLNNRGEDANAIGELDQWGGHCGRADDYHYHLPPTHLQSTVGDGMPIAYALDGFPVYGETTEELDEYLGKFNADSSYQYHSIAEYPYLIAGMRGAVRLDPGTSAPENQVIPQAMTQELRPALTPLAGAEITEFHATAVNSYSLTYSLNSETYVVNYRWDGNHLYTYEFVNPDGTTTVETYQR